MKKYSAEFKAEIVEKMLLPQKNRDRISKLCEETGVSSSSLYRWREEYLKAKVKPTVSTKGTIKWSAETKLQVIIETASLNEIETSQYCRHKGLYPEQLHEWKNIMVNKVKKEPSKKIKIVKKQSIENYLEAKITIKKLEKELRRKDKALAETAALLVLSKKYEAIWGAQEED